MTRRTAVIGGMVAAGVIVLSILAWWLVVPDGVIVLTVSALSCDGADEPLGASLGETGAPAAALCPSSDFN